jgi:hypothetical protein
MPRLSIALHGTLGSDLCDDFQEGSVDVWGCLLVPRAKAYGVFSSLHLVAWWFPLPFLVIINITYAASTI